jgi:hypothetical protein
MLLTPLPSRENFVAVKAEDKEEKWMIDDASETWRSIAYTKGSLDDKRYAPHVPKLNFLMTISDQSFKISEVFPVG